MPKPTIKSYRLKSLSGGINSISEPDQLATFSTPQQEVQAESPDIENFMPLNRGGQTTTFGYNLFVSSPPVTWASITPITWAAWTQDNWDNITTNPNTTTNLHPINGIYRYTQASTTSYFLFAQNTHIYKVTSGITYVTSITITANALVHFETAENYLVVCDGTKAPLSWTGTTVATISNGAPTGARQSLWYQNRLWVFSVTEDTSYLYYSSEDDITTGYDGSSGTGGGFVQCNYQDGLAITAIAPYFLPGTLDPVIMVSKTDGVGGLGNVGFILGDGTTANPYTYYVVNVDFGVPGFRQFVQYGQVIAYLTPHGIAEFDTGGGNVAVLYTQSKLPYTYLSEKVRNAFQALPQEYLPNAVAWHDWLYTRITYAVTEANNTYNNVLWHFDYRLECWYKTRPAHHVISAFVDTDGTLYTGDENGNIFHWTSGFTYFNASTINAYYKTPYMDFGSPHARKQLKQASILCQSNQTMNFGIGNSIDYGDRSAIGNNISVGGGSYTWGGGVWTSNPAVYQWGVGGVNIKRFYPSAYFRNLQFIIQSAAPGAALNIYEMIFEMEPEDAY